MNFVFYGKIVNAIYFKGMELLALSGRTEMALEIFRRGGSCSQAVLASFSQTYGLAQQQAFSVAAALGGGVKSGEICGAVSAGAIVIGLKYGSETEFDPEAKRLCTEKTKEFVTRFKEKHTDLVCRVLIEKEPQEPVTEKTGPHKPVCFSLVKDAVLLLEELGY